VVVVVVVVGWDVDLLKEVESGMTNVGMGIMAGRSVVLEELGALLLREQSVRRGQLGDA